MSYNSLTPLEVRDLIARYQSELRKLDFQVNKTTQILNELENYASEVEEALAIEEAVVKELPTGKESKAKPKEVAEKPAKPTKSKGRGRPRKSTTTKRKGPGRPPKAESKKKAPKTNKKESAPDTGPGYRLSEWDQFVISSLKSKQKALITSDFADVAKGNSDIKAGAAQVKVKLNRSLHKLANKKGVLVKVEYDGRGYAYALAEWLNSKGELPKKYAR